MRLQGAVVSLLLRKSMGIWMEMGERSLLSVAAIGNATPHLVYSSFSGCRQEL